MKHIQIYLYLLFFGFVASAQTIEDISFGTDETLEVMTWNIEHFPKNGQTTIDYVSRIIKALDVDIIAVQEVDDVNSFNQLMNGLPDYEGFLTSNKFRGLAFIYKKSTITINNLYEIYKTSSYWRPFPRYPQVMDFNYKKQNFILINNHLKCCGNGTLEATNQDDEEARRAEATNLLKTYIDTNFSDKNVILVGDLNDVLTDVQSNNVFQNFIDDSDNYKFSDTSIATGNSSEWSYPSWPSHLDHILITNELFDEFANINTIVQAIKLENYVGGWSSYDSNISDHRPVAIKFTVNVTLDIADFTEEKPHFSNYPNPFRATTTFSFQNLTENSTLKIVNILGQKVFEASILKGEKSISWNAENFSNGIYIAKLLSKNNKLATIKLVLRK